MVNIANKDTHTFYNFLPSNRVLRKMGLFSDQDGILRRYLNEGRNWQSHLENTKQVIVDFIEQKSAKEISILGSGWMLDIPIRYLADTMDKVIFYDLRHPRGIRDKYARYSKFHFIEMDLTGGLIQLAYSLGRERKKKPDVVSEIESAIPATKNLSEPGTDFIISVNLLNQLDILIVDYLKRFYTLDEEILVRIRKYIQLNHLNILRPKHSCLITDVSEMHLNDKDEVTDTLPLVFCNLPAGSQVREWVWKFDTQKTYHSACTTNLLVKAFYL
jgi:hypothetical protein